MEKVTKITLNSMYHRPLVPMHCVPAAFQVYQTFGRKAAFPLSTERKQFYRVVDRCITTSPQSWDRKGSTTAQLERDSWKANKIQEMRWLCRQKSVWKVVLSKSWANVLRSIVMNSTSTDPCGTDHKMTLQKSSLISHSQYLSLPMTSLPQIFNL